MPTTAQTLYADAVRALPRREQLRLAALILDELARSGVETEESGHDWSAEDEHDVTAFALHYAESVYPEGEELV